MINWFPDAAANLVRLAVGYGIRFYGSVTGSIACKPADTSDGTTYILPATAPTDSGQSLTSTTNGELSWVDTSGRLIWSETTGGIGLTSNHGYIANNASLVLTTLPAAAQQGDMIKVVGKGAGGWKIQQGIGQSIHFGSRSSTQGNGGSVASTLTFDSIELVCITDNTDWLVSSAQGNLTVT